MKDDTDLLQRLAKGAERFSANQRVLAKFLHSHYQTVAFSNVSQFAEQSGVSEATVVRFAKALGFRGYPDFQKEVRRLVRADLKGTERFQLSPADASPLDIVLQKEMENLGALREGFDPSAFRQALKLLRGASEVLVVGARATAPLAGHLAFGLGKLGMRCSRASSVTSDTYDQIHRLDRKACVVVIGFPRYLRELVEVLDFAKAANSPRSRSPTAHFRRCAATSACTRRRSPRRSLLSTLRRSSSSTRCCTSSAWAIATRRSRRSTASRKWPSSGSFSRRGRR